MKKITSMLISSLGACLIFVAIIITFFYSWKAICVILTIAGSFAGFFGMSQWEKNNE